MRPTTATWLREHQALITQRWQESALPAYAGSNGNGVVPHAVSPERQPMMPAIFAGLLARSEGDSAPLDQILYTLCNMAEIEWPLPDLIMLGFNLRRVVQELLGTEGCEPHERIAIGEDLDAAVEYLLATVSRERISQSDFLASRLADATEEADRAALQLSVLNEVSQQISSSLDMTQLLTLVAGKLQELLGAAHISIWLKTADNGLRCLYSLDRNEPSLIGMTLLVDLGDDLVLRAFRSNRNLWSFTLDPAVQGPWYRAGCGVVALPLLSQDLATGVIVLQDPDPEQQLSRRQQNLARAIANQAAIALENAQLYEQIQHFNSELEDLVAERTGELQAEQARLRTVHEIAQEVNSTLDLDSLLRNSLEALARFTNAQHGSVMLLEADTGHLVSRAVLGMQMDVGFTRFPIGVGIAGWVAQYKRPAQVPDVEADERWVSLPNGEASRRRQGAMLAVPLVAQSEVLGVLTLSHAEPNFFNNDHLRLLSACAGEIAMGIHNANLYNEIVSEMERRAELVHQLERNAGLNAAILQSLSDGVLVCDADGQMLTVNAAAESIMQRPLEELLISDMHNLLAQLAAKRAAELPLDDLLAQPLNAQRQPRMFQSTFQIGLRTVSVTMGPVLTERQELVGAFGLLRDITREVESDRMKTEFIGTMSHELRTPMTSIKGFTQLLAMGSLGTVNDTQKEFLSTIHINAERMISIINDVLDITKIEIGSIDLDLRPLHLAESISSAVSELQQLIQSRGHQLGISLPASLPLVTADAKRLHQALINLISNAAKYTPRGGKIDIDARDVAFDTLPVDVREQLNARKRYVQINIRDTGVGIAPEDLNRVFERFFRTENSLKIEAGGTGLGLSLVRPLITLLGGQIWVESTIGEGSTFSFVVPIA